jgi:hypothetical protein
MCRSEGNRILGFPVVAESLWSGVKELKKSGHPDRKEESLEREGYERTKNHPDRRL